MISIIICSTKKQPPESLIRNIGDTIGVPFEIISVDNSNNRYGICSAYNMAITKAAYNILCFMHEDIYFETPDWGTRISRHLDDRRIGLIGIAGGDTKSLVPSSWSSLIHVSEICVVQHFKNDRRPPERMRRTASPADPSTRKPVVCIDGVFMSTRRDVVDKYKFDEHTFPGFHGYDIDYSLQVSEEYAVCAISDIVIHHYSEGSFNRIWLQTAMRLSRKWRTRLPKSVRQLSRKQYVHQHWTAMRNFIAKMIELDYGLVLMFRLFCKYSFNRLFHVKHFLHFTKIIIQYKTRIRKKNVPFD